MNNTDETLTTETPPKRSLQQGFRNIEQSSEAFANLFQDIDLYSRKLGASPQKQNETISGIMKELAAIDFAGHNGDILGDAYEYMIGQFASDSGKKAGEFYTPQAVSELMTKFVMHGKEQQKGFTIYDPTMGSGSLMLNVQKETQEPATVLYFGQYWPRVKEAYIQMVKEAVLPLRTRE